MLLEHTNYMEQFLLILTLAFLQEMKGMRSCSLFFILKVVSNPCCNVLPRFSADSVDVVAKMTIRPKGSQVEVVDLQMAIALDDIHVELECLFPRDGACCPKKYLKSCNSILSKTVHRCP